MKYLSMVKQNRVHGKNSSIQRRTPSGTTTQEQDRTLGTVHCRSRKNLYANGMDLNLLVDLNLKNDVVVYFQMHLHTKAISAQLTPGIVKPAACGIPVSLSQLALFVGTLCLVKAKME